MSCRWSRLPESTSGRLGRSAFYRRRERLFSVKAAATMVARAGLRRKMKPPARAPPRPEGAFLEQMEGPHAQAFRAPAFLLLVLAVGAADEDQGHDQGDAAKMAEVVAAARATTNAGRS